MAGTGTWNVCTETEAGPLGSALLWNGTWLLGGNAVQRRVPRRLHRIAPLPPSSTPVCLNRPKWEGGWALSEKRAAVTQPKNEQQLQPQAQRPARVDGKLKQAPSSTDIPVANVCDPCRSL